MSLFRTLVIVFLNVNYGTLQKRSLHNHDNRDAFKMTSPKCLNVGGICTACLTSFNSQIHLKYCKVEIWQIQLLHKSKDLVIVEPDTSLRGWWQENISDFVPARHASQKTDRVFYCTSETDSRSSLKFECMFTHDLGEPEPKAHFHLWRHPHFETVSADARVCKHALRPSRICSEKVVGPSVVRLGFASRGIAACAAVQYVWGQAEVFRAEYAWTSQYALQMHRCQWFPPESLP